MIITFLSKTGKKGDVTYTWMLYCIYFLTSLHLGFSDKNLNSIEFAIQTK